MELNICVLIRWNTNLKIFCKFLLVCIDVTKIYSFNWNQIGITNKEKITSGSNDEVAHSSRDFTGISAVQTI